MTKNKEILPTEILEAFKQMEKEGRFWEKLEKIGFETHRNCIDDMHHIKHLTLPLNTSFYMERKEMNILKMTVNTGVWIIPNIDMPLMSCETFIKFQIFRIRKTTKELLDKLDNVVL